MMQKKPIPCQAYAHGRVNLIGEHTDYNGGWVLPTAIPQKTTATLTPRADLQIQIESGVDPKSGKLRHSSYTLGQEIRRQDWCDYIQGITFVLRRAGHTLQGFDLKIESDVPQGSGLSSSAALEISVLKAIRSSHSLDISDVEIAKLGQQVENDFVGARVGIMDQMACCYARAGEALFLDTFDLSHRNVCIPEDHVELVVVNSGVTHAFASGGGYNQRRAECESACEKLGVKTLRELSVRDLPQIEKLNEPYRRRARHVITENARVHAAVQALETENFQRLGELFYESHASMRDDYEVSVPEIDYLVETARAEPGVYGARLTGGGFGGSIVALVKAGEAARIGSAVLAKYRAVSPGLGSLLVPSIR